MFSRHSLEVAHRVIPKLHLDYFVRTQGTVGVVVEATSIEEAQDISLALPGGNCLISHTVYHFSLNGGSVR